MWSSSCNTNSKPKQKSIAARATLSGFDANTVYNQNKLETTKFIVTLKPIHKQSAEESSKTSPTSKDLCRCEGKIIKGHEKVQVKADDVLKGKTILNAFRLLANSKFVSVDNNYEPHDATIILPSTKLMQQSTESTAHNNDFKTNVNRNSHSKKLETKEHINFVTRTPLKVSSDKSNQVNLCTDNNLENLKKMIIDRIRKSQGTKLRKEMQKRDNKHKPDSKENQDKDKSENQNKNERQNQQQTSIEGPEQSSKLSQNQSQDQCGNKIQNQNLNLSTNLNQMSSQSQDQKTQPNSRECAAKAPQNLQRNRIQIRSQSVSPNARSNRYTREQNNRNLNQSQNVSGNFYTICKTLTSPSLYQHKSQNQNLEQNRNHDQNLHTKLNNKQNKNQQQNQNDNQHKSRNQHLNTTLDMNLNSKSFVSTNQNEVQNGNQQQIQIQSKNQHKQKNKTSTPNSSPTRNSSPTTKQQIKPFPFLRKSKNQYRTQNRNQNQATINSQDQNHRQNTNPHRNENQYQYQNQNNNQNSYQNPCNHVRQNENKNQTQNHNQNEYPREIQYAIENQNQIQNQTMVKEQNQNKMQAINQTKNQNQSQDQYESFEEYRNQSQKQNQCNKVQSEEHIFSDTKTNDTLTYDISRTGTNSSANHSEDYGATTEDNIDGDDMHNVADDENNNYVAEAEDDDDDDKERLTGGNDNKRAQSPRESLNDPRREPLHNRDSLRDYRDSFRSALDTPPGQYPRNSPYPIDMSMSRRECFRNLRGYDPSPSRRPEPLPREVVSKGKAKGKEKDKDKAKDKDKSKDKRKSKDKDTLPKKRGSKKKEDDEDDEEDKKSRGKRTSLKRQGLQKSVSHDPYERKVSIAENCCDRSCSYRKAVSQQPIIVNQYDNLGCDRIEVLEDQLEQLRLELGGIRTEVMPNDADNTRFIALDKRLMELNFLINDMKLNCGLDDKRYPRSSNLSQYPSQHQMKYSSQYQMQNARNSLAARSMSPEPKIEQPSNSRLKTRHSDLQSGPSRAQAPSKRGARRLSEEDLEKIESEDSIQAEPPRTRVRDDIPHKPFKCELCDCNSDIDAARKLANCIFIRTKKCTCDNCDCEKIEAYKREACMMLPEDLPEEIEEEEEEEEDDPFLYYRKETNQKIAETACRCNEERPSRKDCETETVSKEDKDTCTEDMPTYISAGPDNERGNSYGSSNYNDVRRSSIYDYYSSEDNNNRRSSNSRNNSSFHRSSRDEQPALGQGNSSNGRNNSSFRRSSRDEQPVLGQGNSFCRYCNNSNYPVIDDNELCVEVMRRLGQHCVNEIALTILLQSNGLYHINIAVIATGEHIACLYATELAIRCANQTNFFEDIMTFFIVDAKNTNSQKNQILKHTFEFVDDDRK